MAPTSVLAGCTVWCKLCSFLVCLRIILLGTTNIKNLEAVPTICSRILTRRPLISFGPVTSLISRYPGNGTIFALSWTYFQEKSLPGTFLENLMLNWLELLFFKAYTARKRPQGLMFHSDRGTQYTAFSFRQLLDSLNVVQSFSNKGYPFDNACCESFFKYLKKEETNRRTYHSLQELQLSVFEYIEGFYNSKRPHGSLNLLTPNEMEALYWESQLWYSQ